MVNGKKKRKKWKKKKKRRGNLSETIAEVSYIEDHPDNKPLSKDVPSETIKELPEDEQEEEGE